MDATTHFKRAGSTDKCVLCVCERKGHGHQRPAQNYKAFIAPIYTTWVVPGSRLKSLAARCSASARVSIITIRNYL